jgi:isoquinoline 1-oxidoreductase subunit alpha
MYTLNINNQPYSVNVEPGTPLLWVLRDTIGLVGTKFGCGIAACGACTVIVDGQAQRSCSLPIESLGAASVLTIDAIEHDEVGRRVVAAWVKNDVPQCGYCQSGQVMAATALLKNSPQPSESDIEAAMTNLCRCGTYNFIKAAVADAAVT